jgi:pyrroloquinoline quinone biosynthesis protein D
MNDNLTLSLTPVLAPCSTLCFNEAMQRWAIEAPDLRIPLDSLSLDVLLACDGEHSLQGIAQSLDRTLHALERPALEITLEIITRFLGLGILRA